MNLLSQIFFQEDPPFAGYLSEDVKDVVIDGASTARVKVILYRPRIS